MSLVIASTIGVVSAVCANKFRAVSAGTIGAVSASTNSSDRECAVGCQ